MTSLELKVGRAEGESSGEAQAPTLGPPRSEVGRKVPRVLMAAGGTGGHIFPALAVAEELRAREARRAPGRPFSVEIEFLGTGRGIEARVIPARGFRLRTIPAAGLKGIRGFRRLLNLLVLVRSLVEAAKVLRDFQPEVVVGVGGYLAGPAMLEAALKEIPTLLIEPNAVPGFTNRLLASVVRRAAVGFEEAVATYGSKAALTGHPVREGFFSVPPKKHAPPFTILILGGSQGAQALNWCVLETLPLLSSESASWRFIHQTGERDCAAAHEAYRASGVEGDVRAFIEDVPGALARADLVVSRAGAMTVAELAAAGKAALLVPFPGATDQHQMVNARARERAGAARVIPQAELTPQKLLGGLRELLADPERLVAMERSAKGLARPRAAEQIADLIMELAR